MQIGPYHPANRGSGVWSLRILGFRAAESFLLIARTPRIVTAALLGDEYRRILGYSSIQPDLVLGTTAVQAIVTAAVYRGFGRELHLAINPLP